MKTLENPADLRAVLFDRDGTVAVTDGSVYREAAEWLAARTGLDAHVTLQALTEQWRAHAEGWREVRGEDGEARFWAAYMETLSRRLGLGEEDAQALLDTFPYERYLRAAPGAREVLSALQARGLRIGVLSNTFPSILRTLEAVELADLVDVAVASCTVGVHKPEAGAYRYALERLGLPARAVLFVDDLPENVEAARALGMPAVQIDLNGAVEEAVHSLQELLALLEGPA